MLVTSLFFSRIRRLRIDEVGTSFMTSLLTSVPGIVYACGSVVSTGSSVTSKAMILFVLV